MEEKEIKELEEFFRSKNLKVPIDLNQYTKITDIEVFLDSHFSIIRGTSAERLKKQSINRLKLLKQKLWD